MKQEVFRRDTISQTLEHLGEVLSTINVDDELLEVWIEPMRRQGEVIGYETTIRWRDHLPYIR